MAKIDVFDPPLCCSSGVCGTDPDPELSRISADLKWLSDQGVQVRRYNLTQEPAAFTANPLIKQIVDATDGDGLPVVLVNGIVVSQGEYPTRKQLSELTGVASVDAAKPAQAAVVAQPPIFDERIAELVAIGAAIASNCETGLMYHCRRAAELGISPDDMIQAVDVALRVKEQPAKHMIQLAQELLMPEAEQSGCGSDCGCGT